MDADHPVWGMVREILYWILFSVVLSLAQLWLVPCLYYVANKPWTWIELVGNGSLLFFATTITSKTAGEYFKKTKVHKDLATLVCLGPTILIVIASVFFYAIVTATRVGIFPMGSLSPDRVALMSCVLAATGLLFSLSFTIYIRVLDK